MDGPVLYDANVLYPASVRDLFLRLGVVGLVTPRWTQQILDEMTEALLSKHAHLDRTRLERTRDLMCQAIPECLIEDYEHLIPNLTLPDPDDRHVLAAAIQGNVEVIVTQNLKDFPKSALASHGITVTDPDSFVDELLAVAPAEVIVVIAEQADALRKPPQRIENLIERLDKNGLRRSMKSVRDLRQA